MISISLTWHSGEQIVYKLSYNHYGIPDEWNDLMDEITRFMSFYGLFGEIFDSDIFKHGVKKDEYIYCSVEFDGGVKTYYENDCHTNYLVRQSFFLTILLEICIISSIK